MNGAPIASVAASDPKHLSCPVSELSSSDVSSSLSLSSLCQVVRVGSITITNRYSSEFQYYLGFHKNENELVLADTCWQSCDHVWGSQVWVTHPEVLGEPIGKKVQIFIPYNLPSSFGT